ncbi:MAG: DUF2892 domain-containing protein [Halosimplex sp.]
MKPTAILRDRSRLVRTLSAAGLALLSLRSFRTGKRLRGALAGLGAVALGYSATSGTGDVTDALETGPIDADVFDSDTVESGTDDAGAHGDADAHAEAGADSDRLRCPVCGEPIVAGERRRPDENGETAHEACLEAPA